MAGYIGKGQPLVSNGAERKFKYVATAGQTVFNATYSVGSVHVYRTGVRLTDGVDYTATNGSTVTLTTGCNAGDDVVIVSTSGFQVADAYTKAESYNKTEVNGMIPTLSTLSIANHENIVVDNAGRVTMPYQPAFSVAKTNGAQADTNPISFNIIDVNVGNNFNGSRFTAPVSGNYYFNSMLLTNSGLSLNYSLRVNGSMYRTTENTSSNTSYKGVSLSCIVPMNAGDYVELNSNNYSVYGGGGNYSMFTGYLIG